MTLSYFMTLIYVWYVLIEHSPPFDIKAPYPAKSTHADELADGLF